MRGVYNVNFEHLIGDKIVFLMEALIIVDKIILY